ncbi:protein unc-13 homolog isoform X5 [Quercus suber]|uniref:protein unc-13 homolog isoform X5 n=1 Tax=Quercus suber TaxID=58331 RepID=UPI0032DEE4F2
MMEEQPYLLLQRYRRDRRNLLEFLFSSSLIKELRTPAGHVTSLRDLDFDNLSVDYILHSIKSGGVVDISEATKKYFDESSYPVMIQSQLGDSYFLLSDPDMSGSPPRRAPPPIDVNRTADNASYSSRQPDPLIVENIGASMDNFSPKYNATTCTPLSQVEDVNIPPLGLPCLNTACFHLLSPLIHTFRILEGLSDDDLQESAYEILLSSLVFSGIEVHTVEDRRKEKSSKFLSGLKTKREKINQQSQGRGRHSELVDTIRIQMQISEAMDACIRQRLTQLAGRRIWESIDIPKISLGLLNSVFKSDFLNEKSYIHWKSRQASILEELLYFSANLEAYERETIKSSLSKIRNSKEWDITMSPSERAEVLLPITQVELKLSSLSGKFSIQGETYCWTAGYHLNIRLYEKLLFGVFDVLDEGQFIEASHRKCIMHYMGGSFSSSM